MATYYFATDSVMTTIVAGSVDAAAADFAKGEGLKARTAADLVAEIAAVGDGAWLTIDDDFGRIEST